MGNYSGKQARATNNLPGPNHPLAPANSDNRVTNNGSRIPSTSIVDKKDTIKSILKSTHKDSNSMSSSNSSRQSVTFDDERNPKIAPSIFTDDPQSSTIKRSSRHPNRQMINPSNLNSIYSNSTETLKYDPDFNQTAIARPLLNFNGNYTFSTEDRPALHPQNRLISPHQAPFHSKKIHNSMSNSSDTLNNHTNPNSTKRSIHSNQGNIRIVYADGYNHRQHRRNEELLRSECDLSLKYTDTVQPLKPRFQIIPNVKPFSSVNPNSHLSQNYLDYNSKSAVSPNNYYSVRPSNLKFRNAQTLNGSMFNLSTNM